MSSPYYESKRLLAVAELQVRNFPLGAGQTAWWFKVCTDLAEDPGSVPSIYMVARNDRPKGPMSFDLYGHPAKHSFT